MLNNILEKNEEKKILQKYLIVCALTETEGHINSFQVKVHSPCHLRTSENLWFLIFLGGRIEIEHWPEMG